MTGQKKGGVLFWILSAVFTTVFLIPQSAFPVNDICVLSPSHLSSCLEELEASDLGTRIPLILIHGWNSQSVPASPQKEVWANFLFYYLTNPSLKNKFKAYYFSYHSNDISVFDLGGKLRDVLDEKNAIDPTNFGSKPVAILAHSMGGLIARSYMQQHWQANGAFAGKPGGERVLKLITLGTPHYGSPLANGDALRWRLPQWGASISAYSEFLLKVDYDELNRANLRWDNHDGLLNYSLFPDEQNPWLLNDLNTGTTYANKIGAYASVFSNETFCPNLSLPHAELAYNCGQLILSDGLGIPNDGLVPLESALFDNHVDSSQQRIFSQQNYNHSEIATGYPGDGDAIFNRLRADLEGIPVISWLTLPPSPMISGQNYTVSWKILGGTTVGHTNIHWDIVLLEVLFVTVAVVTWREHMGLLEFQSHRLSRAGLMPHQERKNNGA